MDSRALINETLKYLEKNENGQPKYRFDIYKNGVAQSINKATSLLTAGVVNDAVAEDKSAPTPVSVYTIGDIFSTAKSIRGDAATVFQNIKNLPSELDNVKASLKQLGFNALDKTIDTIKAAVVPIEVIQTVNSIYRIARPLVEKVVDIASIMFHFENAAKVAQDVLQYLSRLAVSTARNYLNRLWELFLDTPVFAVYENDETASLSGAYALLSNEANNVLEALVNSKDTFNDMLTYINSASDKKMYEPGYNNLGITIPDDIVDVYSDPNTRKIFIASSTEIYQLNEDYSTTIITSTTGIEKIFYYNGKVYFIKSDGIHRANDSYLWNPANPVIVYSNPLLIYSDGNEDSENDGFYNPENTTTPAFSGTLGTNKLTAFDNVRGILYYISNNNKLMMVSRDELGNYRTTPSELGPVSSGIKSMVYFNNFLYIVIGNKVEKINAGMNFDRVDYTGSTLKITNINSDFAVDGTYIYDYSTSSDSVVMSSPKKPSNSVNCAIKKTYNGSNYMFATGGMTIGISKNNGPWFNKGFNNAYIQTGSGDIPDNFAGCNWFYSNAYGDFLIVNSQNNVYAVGADKLSNLLLVPNGQSPDNLCYKNFVSFDTFFTDRAARTGEVDNMADYSASLNTNCIITKVKPINNRLYIALHNPTLSSSSNQSTVRSGIYEIVFGQSSGGYNIAIDYSHPKYTVKTDDNHKIYSFDFISNELYFTDGKFLYNASTGSVSDLELDDEENGEKDRAIEVKNDSGTLKIYTSKGVLIKQETSNKGEIRSSIKYKSDNLSLASTENILMISDGNFIYSSVDNGDDAIKSELFQVCFRKGANDFNLIQSNNAAFIISKNSIKKVPLYDSISSSDYGCGYYTDTTPNKWMGAAPYYFVSNSLNNKKNTLNRDVFIKGFKENFKVELEKLLRHIPDAFVSYMNDKLVDELKNVGIEIDGDDGQIADLMINSVSSTTANALGMYVHDKFMEKIGDDATYNTFAENVYQACLEDDTNNMTKDFYDIFSELYMSTITESLAEMNFGSEGISGFLLRYYQNHKAEWAQSMTDLIDIDIVDPDYYEIPLKSSEATTIENTYVFDYKSGSYTHKYVASPAKEYNEVIDGYLYNNNFYEDASHSSSSIIDERTASSYVTISDASYAESWLMGGETICYLNPDDTEYYKFRLQNFQLSEDSSAAASKTYYEKTAETSEYVLTQDTEEGDKPYYKAFEFISTTDTSVVDDKTYYTKTGTGEITYNLASLASGASYLPLGTYFEKQEYQLTNDTSVTEGKNYYQNTLTPVSGALSNDVQYYNMDYVKTEDTEVDSDKVYYEELVLSEFNGEELYIYDTTTTGVQRYSVNYVRLPEGDYTQFEDHYLYNPDAQDTRFYVDFEINSDGTYVYDNGKYVYLYDVGFEADNNDFYVSKDGGSYYEHVPVKYTAQSASTSDYGRYTLNTDIYVYDNKERYAPTFHEDASGAYYFDSELGYYVYGEGASGATKYTPNNPSTSENGRYNSVNDHYVYDTNTRYNVTWTENNSGRYYKNGAVYVYTTFYKVKGYKGGEGSYYYNGSYYIHTSGSTKYSVLSVRQSILTFDEDQIYYQLINGKYEEVPREELNEQYGPYYYADGFIKDNNGKYIKQELSDASTTFSEVAYPNITNLSNYYEYKLVESTLPYSSSIAYYENTFAVVTSPTNIDIGSYYEKTNAFVAADDVTYVYDTDGNAIGIELNKVLYEATNPELDYSIVENPEGNPSEQGWYEVSDFKQIIPGSTANPKLDELYEYNFSPTSFTAVPSPSGSPVEHGWYENTVSYITPYEDGKIYVNLSAVSVTSYFPYYDNRWHNSFYTAASQAASSVLPGDNLEQAKQHATAALDGIVFPYPEWQWEALLNESVTTLYIPKQGDQFRQIVMDSNMYPIQWQELPYEIDRKSFDYALTTLLYMIKQRLLTNITILVDGGKVKCYSCVDATTVIKKIISRNHLIWRNQIRTAKAKVEKATSKNEVIAVFNMVKAYDKTLYLLENILNEQSRLYARYIDMLIEEQIINDNETEVTL